CGRCGVRTAPPAVRRRDSVPAGVAAGPIALGQRGPLGAGKTIQLVDNLAVTQGHLAAQFLRASETSAISINETELALLKPEYRHVGRCPDRKMPQLLLLDLASGVPCRADDHLFER